MLEKVVVLFVSFTVLVGFDKAMRKKKLGKAKLPYALILGCALYLGADYLLPAKLPHANELLDLLFQQLAKAVETAWHQPAA